MIYHVPIFYELVQYVEVQFPEGTDIKIIREKALEKFKETPLDISNSKYIPDSEEIDEYAPVFMETENSRIVI